MDENKEAQLREYLRDEWNNSEESKWVGESIDKGANFLDWVKKNGKELGKKYGPQFLQYLDKALQKAKPVGDKLQQKIDEFSLVNAPNNDALQNYVSVVTEVRKIATEILPKTNQLSTTMAGLNEKIRANITVMNAIAGELRGHFREGRLYLNDDSAELLDKFNAQKKDLDTNIKALLDAIENTNDLIGDMGLVGREHQFKFLK